jgi:hypothetical protein
MSLITYLLVATLAVYAATPEDPAPKPRGTAEAAPAEVAPAPSGSVCDHYISEAPDTAPAKESLARASTLPAADDQSRFSIALVRPLSKSIVGVVKISTSDSGDIVITPEHVPAETLEWVLLRAEPSQEGYGTAVGVYLPGTEWNRSESVAQTWTGSTLFPYKGENISRGEVETISPLGAMKYSVGAGRHLLTVDQVKQCLESKAVGDVGWAHLIPRNLPGLPAAAGSVWWMVGTVKLFGATFEGNPEDPLRFVLSDRAGLLYLSGTGRVTQGSGSPVALP